ncbi:MAG: hypothetical protein WA941_00625 [Nitrososphaeraceae archaeon]
MISPDYISEDRYVHFLKIKKTIELAYKQVIESLSEKVLPYNPNIYPIPFMITNTYTVHARLVRVLFYSIVYPDKDNFERFAIYPTMALIERLSDYLVGAIGHEIAHIIALEGKVSISKSDLYSLLRNRVGSAKTKEKRAEAVYKFFKEPVLSEIVKWDYISIQKDTEEIVSKDVLLVSQQSFDRLVFKENLERYHNFIRSKLTKSEGRT